MKNWTTKAAIYITGTVAFGWAAFSFVPAGNAQTLTWDSSGVNAASPFDGSGNWDTTTSLLWSNGATDSAWITGDIAQFGNGGTAGTVTIDDPAGVSSTGLVFNLGGYTIASSGSANTLTLTGTPTINVNGAFTDTISGFLAGTAGFTLNGSGGTGTLALSNANTMSGTITVSNGALLLQNASAVQNATVSVGITNGLSFNAGGTYNVAGLTTGTNSNVALSNSTGTQNVTLSVGGTNTTSAFGGALTDGSSGGIGSLTKVGTGTFTLSGQNTFSGPVAINGGLLVLNSGESGTSGPLGEGGIISFGGGALEYSASNQTDYSSRFSTAAGQLYSVNTNAQTAIWASNLTSSGGTLTKSGTGTLILTGAETYSGTTTVSAGTLQIGNGGNVGSLAGGNVNLTAATATLAFNLNTPYTLSNAISGTGGVTQAGTSTLLLSNNTYGYTGPTTLTSGTLQLGNAPSGNSVALQNSTLTLNGGTLDLGTNTSITIGGLAGTANLNLQNDNLAPVNLILNANTATYSGVLNGSSVTVTKNGANTQTLSGANTYSGTTIVNLGTLTLTNTNSSTSAYVVNGGAFSLTGGTVTIPAAATVTLNPGGTVNWGSGTAETTMPTQANVINVVGNSSTTATITGTGWNNGSAGDIDYLLNGNGNLSWGMGTINLANTNMFLGFGGTVSWGASNSAIRFTGGTTSANAFYTTIDLGTSTGSVLNNKTAGGTIYIGALKGGSTTTIGTSYNVNEGGANTSTTYSGNLNSTFTKQGMGTLTLNPSAVWTTATPLTLEGGTLFASYANLATPTNLFIATSTVGFTGGALELQGKASASTSAQTFGNVTVNNGGGQLIVDPNGASNTFNVTLGTITATAAGGALNILPPNPSIPTTGTVSITTGTNKGADGTYGSRITYGSDWATTASVATPFTLSAYSGYIPFVSSGGSGATAYLLSGSGGGAGFAAESLNSLKIATTGSGQSLDLNGQTLTLGQSAAPTGGGILFAGSNNYTIGVTAGDTLKSGNSATTSDLIVQQLGTGNLTIAAVIANGGSSASTLTKAGFGKLTLTGANTYTGVTFVDNGILSISSNVNLGVEVTGAAIDMMGGTLQATQSFGLFNGSAGTNNRNVVLFGGGGNFDVTGSNVLTIAGTISSNNSPAAAGPLVKTDSGTLVLSGANTYTGITQISGGFISVATLPNGGTAGPIGASPNVADALVFDGGFLQFNGSASASTDRTFTVTANGGGLDSSSASSATTVTFSNTAPVVFSGNAPHTLTLQGSNTGNNVLAASLTDSGINKTSLVKNGTGNWTLTNPSHTYTGNTTVSGGTLLLSAASTNPIPNSAHINVAGGTLDVTGLTNSTIILGAQTLTGSSAVNGSVQAGASSIIVPGTLVTSTSQAGTLTINNNLSLVSGTTLNFALSSANLDGSSLSGADLISTATLTLPSSGVLANLFVPGTTNQFATAGLYDLIHYNTLSGAALNSNTFSVANSNGAFNYTFGTSNNYITLNIVQSAIAASWNDGSISPNNNPGNWSTAANWSGGVPGTGGQGFGDSATFGSTTVAPASGAPITNVVLDASEVLGGITFNNSSSYTVSEPSGGGTNALTMNSGPSNAATIHVISGSHAINVPLVLFQASPSLATTVTVDNATDTLTIGGAISGSGSLTKAGVGTLVLTNPANSYGSGSGGGTNFNGGVVVFDNAAELGAGSLLTFAGGTLRYNGNTDDISTKTITFNAGGGTIDTNGSTVQFANAIGNGGAGGFTKAGAGTLTLLANSTYTGGTTITGGTLAISTDTRLGPAPATATNNLTFNPGTGNTATLQVLGSAATVTLGATRTVVANSGTGLIDTGTNTVIIVGAINGSGALEKAGTGTLTLQGTGGSQTGGIIVDAGTLTVQSSSPVSASSPILLKNNTTLNLLTTGSASNFIGNPTTIAAGATATLTSNNAANGFGESFTFGDPTSILDIAANVSLSTTTQQFGTSVGTVDILSTGGLRWSSTSLNNGGTNTTFQVDGFMTTRNNGAVALGALSGSGTVSGGPSATTNVTYTIGAKGISTTFSGQITDGTTPVAITKVGTGTLTLAGNNSYTQTTTISAGTLQIGDPTVNSGTSGTLGSGSVTNNAALVFARSDNGLTVSNVISGTGTLTQAGTGTTSLTGASTYSGATTVSAGTLSLNNPSGSATGTSNITVGSAATITGSGSATGTATISSGGALAPGNSGVGTLTLGGLNATGTTLNYEFQAFGQPNDVTNVTNSGGLTINAGTGMNVYQAGTTSPYLTNGVYPVLDYVGAINGAGISALSVLNPDPSKSYAFSTSGSQVFLSILPTLTNAIYWNVNGSSTWNTNTHWSPNTIPNGGGVIAAFGGGGATLTTNATITVDAPEIVGEMAFNNTAFPTFSYNIIGANTITLDGSGNTAVIDDIAGSHSIGAPIGLNSDLLINVVNATDTMTISGAISGGASNFANAGAGTVILSGANSYNATNSINQGTVMLSGSGTLGATSNTLNMNGGTLDLGTTTQTTGTVNVVGGNIVHGSLSPSFVNYTGSSTATISSSIIGGTSVQVSGTSTGVLVLSGTNSFTGGVTLNSGTLSVSADNNLGDVTNSSLNLSGGTFQVTGTTFNAFNPSRNVFTYGSAFNISDPGNTFTITPNGNSGGATLVKLGAGTLAIAGTTSYNGAASSSIRGGTLEISGNLTLASTVAAAPGIGIEIAPTTGQTAAVVVDSGAILNTERTVVGGNIANTDGGTGTLTVNGGTINSAQWFTVGSFGTSTGTATLNGASIVNVNSATGTQVEVADFGTASGILNINGTSQLNIYNNGDLALGVNTVSGNGTVNQNGGTVTFYSDNGSTVGSNSTTPAGLRLGKSTGNTGTYTYNLNGGQLIVPIITHTSGTGVFNFNGGTLVPTATSTTFMTGLTTAQVQFGGAFINNNGFNITIGQSLLHDATVGAPAIDGGLNSSGAGALTLTGTNTFTGNTTVAGGTLIAGSTGALENSVLTTGGTGFQFASTVTSHAFSIGGLSGSNALALTDNAAVSVTLSVGGVTVPVNSSYSGVLSGGGGLTKINAGSTFTLNTASTFTGHATVTGGTLALGTPNALPNTSEVVLSGGTLATGGSAQNFTSGTLGLTASSILDLGSASTSTNVNFVNSSTSPPAPWTGTLTINNWTFGTDHLFVGGDATGLTAAQLGDIKFADFAQGASISSGNGIAGPGEVTPLVGDINQDGHVDNRDVLALEKALADTYGSDANSYVSLHPSFQNSYNPLTNLDSDVQFALDVNGDGQVSNADVQALLLLLQAGHGSTSSVPEPASLSLLIIGAVFCVGLKARSRKSKAAI